MIDYTRSARLPHEIFALADHICETSAGAMERVAFVKIDTIRRYAEATDGSMLMRIWLDEDFRLSPDEGDLFEGELLIDAKVLRKLKKFASPDSVVVLGIDKNDEAWISAGEARALFSIGKIGPIDWPDTNDFLSSEFGTAAESTTFVGPYLMGKACQFAKNCGASSMVFKAKEGERPFEISMLGNTRGLRIEGLLAPTNKPYWFREAHEGGDN
jgi:hypothetical protein